MHHSLGYIRHGETETWVQGSTDFVVRSSLTAPSEKPVPVAGRPLVLCVPAEKGGGEEEEEAETAAEKREDSEMGAGEGVCVCACGEGEKWVGKSTEFLIIRLKDT